MVILILILLLICLRKCSFSWFQEDYMSKSKTDAIKGIFVCLIFFSHLRGYIHYPTGNSSMINNSFDMALNYLGQLIVAPYFFYSGYGIMERYKSNSVTYLNGFTVNRIFKTWYHFALAVLLFLIIQSFLGNYFTKYEYAFCWIGWTSIGNSNWFVFDILFLYTLAYVFLLVKEKFHFSNNLFVLCLFSGVALFWAFLHSTHAGSVWWYDTIVTFPLGVLFSLTREDTERKIFMNRSIHLLSFLIIFALFILWHHFFGVDSKGICATLFMVLILLFSSFVSTNNQILQWLGIHSFSIYILQRLPMILLKHIGVSDVILFTAAAFFMTLLLGWIFNLCVKKLDTIILGI